MANCGMMAEEKSLDELFAESQRLRRKSQELIQRSEKLMQKSNELHRRILDKRRPASRLTFVLQSGSA